METPFSLRVTLHPHGKAWAEEDGSTWALSEVAECSEPDWEPVSSLGPHRMPHEVRWGAQGASRVAPGKSGLHARGEGERVLALERNDIFAWKSAFLQDSCQSFYGPE